jgi:hypothetical protein
VRWFIGGQRCLAAHDRLENHKQDFAYTGGKIPAEVLE